MTRPMTIVRLSNVSGDVTVTATDGERVELVATLRGGTSDTEARVEVRQHADGVTICALSGPDSYCDERGGRQEGRNRRSDDDRGLYDLEVRVPRQLRVAGGSVSGNVRVIGTTAELRASSVSGDIRVEGARAADRLSATTVSGDVTAQLISVSAGTELQFRSVSGDVTVLMPQGTGLDLQMSTVSGALTSEFPIEMRGRFSRRRIQAQINQGGSDLRVSTVSGDVRLAHTRGTSQ
jgi:hypothetical protein